MSCFVFSVDKFKSGDVSKIHNHNFRKYQNGTPKFQNIDFDRTKNNELLAGREDTKKIVNEKIEALHLSKKPRSDANVLVNMVFSASPEYFFKALDTPEKIEEWKNLKWKNPKDREKIREVWKSLDPKRLEQWKSTVMEFCKNELGDNVVNIVLHMDEKTPHIHCQSLPITPDKKLSCKRFYTPEAVDGWRSKLELAFDPIGLKRMREDLPGVHTTDEEFNSIDEAEIEQPPKVSAPKPLMEDQIFTKGLLGKKQKISTEEILENRTKREKAYNTKLKFYEKFYNENRKIVASAKKTKLDNEKLKAENKKVKEENMKHKAQYKAMTDDQIEKLRIIDCKEVMERMGIEPTTTDKSKFKTNDFNVVISKENKFFDNVSGVGGYGAIDLMCKVFNYTFKEAREFLAQNFGFDRTAKLITTNEILAEKVVKEKLESEVKELPKPKPNNLPKIYEYLTQKRKIKKELVDDLVSKNLLYADAKNNCVFTNENQTFGFIRGTYEEKRFVGTRGTIDFLKYDFGKSQTNEIYLFESAIDALSYRTLNPNKNGLYVVLNGSALINRVHELGIDGFDKVVCCFDNDEQGKKFCDKIKEQTTSQVVIDKPLSKDFNEDLINGTNKPTNSIDAGNQQNATAVAGETKSIDANATEGNQYHRRRFPK